MGLLLGLLGLFLLLGAIGIGMMLVLLCFGVFALLLACAVLAYTLGALGVPDPWTWSTLLVLGGLAALHFAGEKNNE